MRKTAKELGHDCVYHGSGEAGPRHSKVFKISCFQSFPIYLNRLENLRFRYNGNTADVEMRRMAKRPWPDYLYFWLLRPL